MQLSDLMDVKYHYIDKKDTPYFDNTFDMYEHLAKYTGNNIILVEFKEGIQLIYAVINNIITYDLLFTWKDQINIRNKVTGENWIDISMAKEEVVKLPAKNQLPDTDEEFYREVIFKLIDKI